MLRETVAFLLVRLLAFFDRLSIIGGGGVDCSFMRLCNRNIS